MGGILKSVVNRENRRGEIIRMEQRDGGRVRWIDVSREVWVYECGKRGSDGGLCRYKSDGER